MKYLPSWMIVGIGICASATSLADEEEQGVCEPRAVQQCLCNDDRLGRMVCGAEGEGWTKCFCDGDASEPGETATEFFSPALMVTGGLLALGGLAPLIAGILVFAGGEAPGTGAILVSIGGTAMVGGISFSVLGATPVPARPSSASVVIGPSGVALVTSF